MPKTDLQPLFKKLTEALKELDTIIGGLSDDADDTETLDEFFEMLVDLVNIVESHMSET